MFLFEYQIRIINSTAVRGVVGQTYAWQLILSTGFKSNDKNKNLTKVNQIPVNELNVIKKLFLFKKYSNSNFKNHFISLKNINLEIFGNEKVFVIGKPGSGKSSLFSVLSKKVDYDYGEITISNNIYSSTLIRIPPNLITGLKIKVM